MLVLKILSLVLHDSYFELGMFFISRNTVLALPIYALISACDPLRFLMILSNYIKEFTFSGASHQVSSYTQYQWYSFNYCFFPNLTFFINVNEHDGNASQLLFILDKTITYDWFVRTKNKTPYSLKFDVRCHLSIVKWDQEGNQF